MKKHNIIEISGRKYLECKWCGIVKELIDEYRIRDKNSRLWYVYRCKECSYKKAKAIQKRYRDSHKDRTHEYNLKYNREHRDEIREKRRGNREKENIARKLYRLQHKEEVNKRKREQMHTKWYGWIHQRTARLVKKLWIRPDYCQICWHKGAVVSHHPTYDKPYEIVFCCPSCHTLIHQWKLEIKDEYKILLK